MTSLHGGHQTVILHLRYDMIGHQKRVYKNLEIVISPPIKIHGAPGLKPIYLIEFSWKSVNM